SGPRTNSSQSLVLTPKPWSRTRDSPPRVRPRGRAGRRHRAAAPVRSPAARRARPARAERSRAGRAPGDRRRRPARSVSWSAVPGGLAEKECVQLVAVEIAEVAGVEAVTARARRALVLAAERQGLLVERVDPGLAVDHDRDHDA